MRPTIGLMTKVETPTSAIDGLTRRELLMKLFMLPRRTARSFLSISAKIRMEKSKSMRMIIARRNSIRRRKKMKTLILSPNLQSLNLNLKMVRSHPVESLAPKALREILFIVLIVLLQGPISVLTHDHYMFGITTILFLIRYYVSSSNFYLSNFT